MYPEVFSDDAGFLFHNIVLNDFHFHGENHALQESLLSFQENAAVWNQDLVLQFL